MNKINSIPFLVLFLSVNLHGQTGINTKNPKANLHVNGNMILTKTPVLYEKANVLGINDKGEIGILPVIPAKLMFIQSTKSQKYTDAASIKNINAGNDFVVTWDSSEIITNNIVTYNTQYFEFNEEGIYEVSGFVNYSPNINSTTTTEKYAGVNIAIQYYVNGKWENLAAARSLFSLDFAALSYTINIAPAIKKFGKGDRLRMIFKRPTSGFGIPHERDFGIHRPTGTTFTKGLKIIAY
jgi:hypothetical protein